MASLTVVSVSPINELLEAGIAGSIGYFASVDAINDQGRPLELADLLTEGG